MRAVTAIAAGCVAGFLSVAAIQAVGAQIQRLEQATAQQCWDRAWPAHQAEAHEAFCRTYGYVLGQPK